MEKCVCLFLGISTKSFFCLYVCLFLPKMDLVSFLSFIYMDNLGKGYSLFFYSLVITVTTDQNLIFLFHNNLLTSTTFENDCIFDDIIIILHVDFILTILF